MKSSASACAMLVVLLGSSASAQHSPAASPSKPSTESAPSIAVFEFLTNEKGQEEKAQSIAVLVATRLAQRPGVRVVSTDQIRAALGYERQRALLGCTDESCLVQAAGALGVRYVLQGRYDRFGERQILSAVLVDSRSAQALTRLRQDAPSDSELPSAADRLADGAGDAVGAGAPVVAVAAGSQAGPSDSHIGHVNLRLGYAMDRGMAEASTAVSGQLTLEGQYDLSNALGVFVSFGLVLGKVETKTDGSTESKRVSIVPTVVGLKYTFREGQRMRPYLGIGGGLSVLPAMFGGDWGAVAAHADGIGGLGLMLTERVGVNAEWGARIDTRKIWGFSVNGGLFIKI